MMNPDQTGKRACDELYGWNMNIQVDHWKESHIFSMHVNRYV